MPPKRKTRRKLTKPLSSKYHPVQAKPVRASKQEFVAPEEKDPIGPMVAPVVDVPVESRKRQQCEYKWKEYNMAVDVLGEGATAKVRALCDEKTKCPYVLRMEEFTPTRWRGEPEFIQHVLVASLASENQIGPKLYDAWTCFDEKKQMFVGLMVMDRWDGDLRHFMITDDIVTQVEAKTKKLHQLGYVHGDIWPGNILYRRRGNKTEIVLVDFDRAISIDHIRQNGLSTVEQELRAIDNLRRWKRFEPWSGYDGMDLRARGIDPDRPSY